jgi:DNA-binding beta-propeller fold protein YncE
VLGVHPIGAGFSHRTDPAALVLGPSGVAYDATHDLLYVADSADNTIYSLDKAGGRPSPTTAQKVFFDTLRLHGPLDLGLLPNGDLVVANSDGSNVTPIQPSELVEFTTTGRFIAEQSIDPNNGGAFGFSFVTLGPNAIKFAAVDDNQNSLTSWTSFWTVGSAGTTAKAGTGGIVSYGLGTAP